MLSFYHYPVIFTFAVVAKQEKDRDREDKELHLCTRCVCAVCGCLQEILIKCREKKRPKMDDS